VVGGRSGVLCGGVLLFFHKQKRKVYMLGVRRYVWFNEEQVGVQWCGKEVFVVWAVRMVCCGGVSVLAVVAWRVRCIAGGAWRRHTGVMAAPFCAQELAAVEGVVANGVCACRRNAR